MKTRIALHTLGALALLLAVPLDAQVIGRLPEQAVLADLSDGQRIGAFAGWLTTGRDPVGVGGKSAPIFGLRYDTPMSGPVYFSTRLFGVKSEHDVLDPNAPEDDRNRGTASTNQVGLDVAFDLSLTGQRAWRGLQPLLHAGLGFMVGVGNHFDAGRYATGGSVLFSYGLGGRYTTSRNSELRADLGWLVYQVRYPNAFRTTTVEGDTPLRATGSMTPLTTNRAITLSWTWGVFR
jgi:hypothetical protein